MKQNLYPRPFLFKTTFLITFLLGISITIHSQTQWNADAVGGTTDWNTASNWTNGIPAPYIAANIFSCNTCPVISSPGQHSGYLQIFNGGKLTIQNGGELTVENPGSSALKIWDNAILAIFSNAELTVQNFWGEGISMLGTLDNSGKVEINGGHTAIFALENSSIYNNVSGEYLITGDYLNYGIFTSGQVFNEGKITIKKAIQAGLYQQDGHILNQGEITIEDTGINGIFQKNEIVNAGQININNALTGLYSLSANFDNKENASLNISSNTFLNKGIFANLGVFTNSGNIIINNFQNSAINTSNTLVFDNFGNIEIETNGLYGILNTGNSNFINHPCSRIFAADRIVNWAHFTNNGLMIFETTESSNIETNNGVVYSLNGGNVSIGNGNPVLTNSNRVAWLGCKNKNWADGDNWAFGDVPMFFPPNNKNEAVIPDVSMTSGNSPEVGNIVPPVAGVTMLENSHLTIANAGSLNCIFDTPPDGFFNMEANANLTIAFSGDLKAHEMVLNGNVLNGGAIRITPIINSGGFLQNKGTLNNFGTIEGSTSGNAGSLVTNFGTLTNEGIIDIPVALFGSLNNQGLLTNNNEIRIVGTPGVGGSLSNSMGGIFQNSGDITLTGWMRSISNSTFTNSGTMDIYYESTAVYVNTNSTISNSGTISVAKGRVYNEDGTFDNSGNLNIASPGLGEGIYNQDNFVNSGNILIEFPNLDGITNEVNATFNNQQTGSITVTDPGLGGMANRGSFTNSGTMETEAGSGTPIFISPSGVLANLAGGNINCYSGGNGMSVEGLLENYGNLHVNDPTTIGIFVNDGATFRNFTGGNTLIKNMSNHGIHLFGNMVNTGYMKIQEFNWRGILVEPSGKLENNTNGQIDITDGNTIHAIGIANFSNRFNANTGAINISDIDEGIGFANGGLFFNRIVGTISTNQTGIDGIESWGTLENRGNLILQNAGVYGFQTSGLTTNFETGNISIHTSGEFGFQVGFTTGTVHNYGEISIENSNFAGLNNEGNTFTNHPGATISVSNSTANGVVNQRTFENHGDINISSCTNTGIVNVETSVAAIFNNSGNISVTDQAGLGIENNGNNSTFTNAGNVDISGNGSMSVGWQNIGYFENQPSGVLNVNDSEDIGFLNIATAKNFGSITVDGVVDRFGFVNDGVSFENRSNSELTIRNTGDHGIFNRKSFFNSGIVTVENAGADAIYLETGFINNHPCAEVIIHQRYNSSSTFRNEGLFKTDFAGTNINSGDFINTGIIEDLNDSFNGVLIDNAQIIVSPISGIFGTPIFGALQVGTIPPGYNIGTPWYTDPGLNIPAGNYIGFTGGTYENLFDPANTLLPGTHTLYFEIEDELHPEVCTKIVSIKVNLASPLIGLPLPEGFEEGLSFGNYPNPFINSTDLMFTLPRDAHAKLSIFDMSGKEVKVLFEGKVTGGQEYQFPLDGTDLRAGFYMAKIFSNNGRTFPIKLVKVED